MQVDALDRLTPPLTELVTNIILFIVLLDSMNIVTSYEFSHCIIAIELMNVLLI